MSRVKRCTIKHYYLQCKQFQFVVFGQVRAAVFSGTVEIFFRQRCLSPPRKKGLYHLWL